MELGSRAPDVRAAALDGIYAAVVDTGPFKCWVADIGVEPLDLGAGGRGTKGQYAKPKAPFDY